MSKEKQIEEMAKNIPQKLWSYNIVDRSADMDEKIRGLIAEHLYRAGYRKQSEGEWVKVRNHKECSKCHYRAPYKKIKAGYHLQDLTHYCPNCGAKMKGV